MSECSKCYDADIEMDIIKAELTRTKKMLAVALYCLKAEALHFENGSAAEALAEINKMKEE